MKSDCYTDDLHQSYVDYIPVVDSDQTERKEDIDPSYRYTKEQIHIKENKYTVFENALEPSLLTDYFINFNVFVLLIATEFGWFPFPELNFRGCAKIILIRFHANIRVKMCLDNTH